MRSTKEVNNDHSEPAAKGNQLAGVLNRWEAENSIEAES
jgi:hypothetical protein